MAKKTYTPSARIVLLEGEYSCLAARNGVGCPKTPLAALPVAFVMSFYVPG